VDTGVVSVSVLAGSVIHRSLCSLTVFIDCAVYSYVGNLDPGVTEELLVTLFSQLGSCKGCKIIHEVLLLLLFLTLGTYNPEGD